MTRKVRGHVKQAGGCMERLRTQRNAGDTNLKVDKTSPPDTHKMSVI